MTRKEGLPMIRRNSAFVCCGVLSASLFLACGQSRQSATLSRPVALQLLREQVGTSKPVTYALPLSAVLHDRGAIRNQTELPKLALMDALATSGLMRKTGTERLTDGWGPATVTRYELVEASCKPDAVVQNEYSVDIVVARKEIAEVSGINQGPGGAMVDAVIRATPTECHKKVTAVVGSNISAFHPSLPWPTQFGETKKQVMFAKYDDGWRVGQRLGPQWLD